MARAADDAFVADMILPVKSANIWCLGPAICLGASAQLDRLLRQLLLVLEGLR